MKQHDVSQPSTCEVLAAEACAPARSLLYDLLSPTHHCTSTTSDIACHCLALLRMKRRAPRRRIRSSMTSQQASLLSKVLAFSLIHRVRTTHHGLSHLLKSKDERILSRLSSLLVMFQKATSTPLTLFYSLGMRQDRTWPLRA